MAGRNLESDDENSYLYDIYYDSCCAIAGAGWSPLMAQVYKVVDKDGNVTYTDQPPGDGSKPVELAPISVIEAPTYEKAPEATAEDDAEKKMSLSVSAQKLQGFCNHFPTAGRISLETGWSHIDCLEHAIRTCRKVCR